MFKRVKNLWSLSRFKPTDIAEVRVDKNGESKTVLFLEEDIPMGDGKAEFLGAGTEEEFKEQEREDNGLKGIFGL